MKIEVLLATMNQKNLAILEEMNIQTDVIIANQSNDFKFEKFIYKNEYEVRFYTFFERGIGLNRNNALMRSNADICLLADDDMVYVDNYEEVVRQAFNLYKDADIIMFNVPIHRESGDIIKIKRRHKVNFFNSLKYGAVNIAFKRDSIIKNNIYFSLLFGGGSTYGSGEDSLFIKSCLDKRLKIYAIDQTIAYIDETNSRPSTWFTGYNEKYFFDRGALFAALSTKFWFVLILQFLIRKRNLIGKNMPLLKCVKMMCQGALDFKSKKRF